MLVQRVNVRPGLSSYIMHVRIKLFDRCTGQLLPQEFGNLNSVGEEDGRFIWDRWGESRLERTWRDARTSDRELIDELRRFIKGDCCHGFDLSCGLNETGLLIGLVPKPQCIHKITLMVRTWCRTVLISDTGWLGLATERNNYIHKGDSLVLIVVSRHVFPLKQRYPAADLNNHCGFTTLIL